MDKVKKVLSENFHFVMTNIHKNNFPFKQDFAHIPFMILWRKIARTLCRSCACLQKLFEIGISPSWSRSLATNKNFMLWNTEVLNLKKYLLYSKQMN